ncbi:MAG: hypothetical protein RBR69_03420 [Candidatus Cloacimonadaceae bacterium]|jgi:hypothetical protein|nr:hypothetical protein [Candidatus Cloacimonadota bacterium]MDY0127167.1 hypothetical protein [Candidatus Cloacimonadaceae bacterium]MCB5254434.1 hypothetical protein [Candidatus Cloacimonadota bacterium]MCK9178108.1 hypothetical protein [Candidatus Cloacimonadota bacterium]MCK9241837.1 hypothetical protein [Candidatus Cloacimonadota bacterium]
MKKGILIIISLFVVCSAFAFSKGTLNLGGTASLHIHKDDSDADAQSTFILRPKIGYFIVEDNCIDLIFIYENYFQNDDSISALGLGIGTAYFLKQFYAGIDFIYESLTIDASELKSKATAMFVNPKLGYLVSLTPNVYLDLGAGYTMGIGDYGADSSGSNSSRDLHFNLGLQYYFNR